jgi:murein DD-endopeptidase / murein LD-carboxypeptidase
MIDYNDYVGIPWVCGKADLDGADCWGIVCIVYLDLFGIRLSHFNPNDINSTEKTADKIKSIKRKSDDWVKVARPVDGDVVVMTSRKTLRPEHVGVFIKGGFVLHSLVRESGASEIHSVKHLSKLFKRLDFYRYAT